MQKIVIPTTDGIDIAGLYWDSAAEQSVLLFHMMPATKESWVPLAEKLSTEGMNVLAIDFRGHGESGGGDFQTFTPEQHHGYFIDAQAGVEFLQTKYPTGIITPGGASIGGNLALWLMTKYATTMPRGFALSAGLDYYGVRAIDYVHELHKDQSVLLVGSYDDGRQSGNDCGHMAEQLFEAATSRKEKSIYDTGGHGTNLFAAHPDLVDQVTHFLTN